MFLQLQVFKEWFTPLNQMMHDDVVSGTTNFSPEILCIPETLDLPDEEIVQAEVDKFVQLLIEYMKKPLRKGGING
jgi:hypothetical protein